MISQHKDLLPSRRRDVGIAASIVMLVQLYSSHQSFQNVAAEVEKLKDEFRQSSVENEKYFVHKSDVDKMALKIDQIDAKLNTINNEVVSLKSIIKDDRAALDETDGEIVGCSFEMPGGVYGI